MEVIIQIALIFFFIQFLVVSTIMIVALLLARPDEPVLGLEPEHAALRRSFTFALRLPSRILRSAMRLAQSMNSLRSVH